MVETWEPHLTIVADGLTVADLDRLASVAARNARGWGDDLDEAVAVARLAMLQVLVAGTESGPNLRGELIAAGLRAISSEWQKRLSLYGCADFYASRRGVASRPRFNQFWSDYLGRGPAGHEDAVVDRIALAQILPRLRAEHRQALTTLAETGSYAAAADLLGVAYHTLLTRISRGRRQFLALWHEHEQPSSPWGVDRRAGNDGQRRSSATSSLASILRRRQQGQQARTVRTEVADAS
ncbi:hypothetical protein [Nonomuraea typhae]|uniref:hypothetical protein n=1 Tax=Nonomuraea typhae TaxID=2603600 RepID=UPI0012F915B2|nr:hypothetical protein [Nonomuraea typhae]